MSAPPARAPRSPLAFALAVAGAIATGALLAVQSRINGELGHRLDDGIVAALVSFGTGLALTGLVMLAAPHGRRGLVRLVRAARAGATPWWHLLAGTVGALVVSLQGLTIAVLGVALFTVATVSGQVISAVLIDRRGFGTMESKAPTVPRVIGSLLALVAVIWSVSSRIQSDIPLWMLVLPFVAGLALGWQQAANGQNRVHSGSALTTTFLNFLIGGTVLVLVVGVRTIFVGFPDSAPSEPWLYVGGSIGVILVAIGTVVIPITGVLVAGLGGIAGQLIASVALDLVFPTAGRPVLVSTVIGAGLTLLAAAIATVPWGSLRRRPERS